MCNYSEDIFSPSSVSICIATQIANRPKNTHAMVKAEHIWANQNGNDAIPTMIDNKPNATQRSLLFPNQRINFFTIRSYNFIIITPIETRLPFTYGHHLLNSVP